VTLSEAYSGAEISRKREDDLLLGIGNNIRSVRFRNCAALRGEIAVSMIRQFAAICLAIGILGGAPIAATAASPVASLNRQKWISVADHLVQTPPESYPYDWGEATLFIGLIKTYERTHSPTYLDYAEKWAALYTRESREEILELNGGPQPGDCNRWTAGALMLSLYQERNKPEYLRMVRKAASTTGRAVTSTGLTLYTWLVRFWPGPADWKTSPRMSMMPRSSSSCMRATCKTTKPVSSTTCEIGRRANSPQYCGVVVTAG